MPHYLKELNNGLHNSELEILKESLILKMYKVVFKISHKKIVKLKKLPVILKLDL